MSEVEPNSAVTFSALGDEALVPTTQTTNVALFGLEEWQATQALKFSLGGRIPINTSGGLKSKGHPVGASGAAQAVEVWKQMRGQAGERQVDRDVDLAMTHNVGGTGQTAVVHIYERR